RGRSIVARDKGPRSLGARRQQRGGGAGRRLLWKLMSATLRPLLEREDLGLTLLHGDPETAYGSVAVVGRESDRPWLAASDLRLHEGRFSLPRPPADPVLDPPPAAVLHALSPRQRTVPQALVER